LVPDCMRPASIAEALGGSPQRVLVVGSRALEHQPLWSGSGAEVRIAHDSARLPEGSGPWDVVILDGALERERWDRWYLQRLHREIRSGGLLLLRVDHLFDLGTTEGLAYVASRVARQLGRRFERRGALPAADRSAFRGRRYAPAALTAMVAGLAFEPGIAHVEGHGWPGLSASSLGPLTRRTARFVVLSARRAPSLWGAARPFPEPAATRARFAASHAAALAARDEWAARRGEATAPRALDIADLARRGVLVLSPHPDDEVIGCGGTLLDVSAQGGAITIVQVTDGSDSAAFIDEPDSVRRQVRLDEAARVARGLGARELVCLRADNRALRATPELSARVRDVLEHTRPGTVFAPSFTDIHPDHQTVLRLLAEALAELPRPLPDVALYEVWSLVAPTHVHDVNGRMAGIEALLLDYETALKIDDYVHLVAERLLYNSLEHRGQPGYAEVFEIVPAERFLALASAHLGSAGRS